MAVYVGPALLLVRRSYRAGWHLPGYGVRRGETPEEAARRELAEEVGLTAAPLLPVGVVCTNWDGRCDRDARGVGAADRNRRDRIHFFELRLVEPPKLRLDNREVIAARLTSPFELQNTALTGLVAAYLARRQLLGWSRCSLAYIDKFRAAVRDGATPAPERSADSLYPKRYLDIVFAAVACARFS